MKPTEERPDDMANPDDRERIAKPQWSRPRNGRMTAREI
jgi:hypothetical protein